MGSLEGRGPQTDKTPAAVPLQVNFLVNDKLLYISLILLRVIVKKYHTVTLLYGPFIVALQGIIGGKSAQNDDIKE